MRRVLWTLLIALALTSWLIGPTGALASGSESIPPVTPIYQGQAAPYTGLLFPEAAARANDALTEAAIAKAKLYETRIGELSLQLDVAEAALVVANDSLADLPSLVQQVNAQAYKAGFNKGRSGLGAFVGVNLLEGEPAAGVGYVFRF